MSAGLSTRLTAQFDDAVARTREALARQGLSVLTEIDLAAKLQALLGVDMEDYLILSTCDPALTYRAISVDREIGLLLPCSMLVRADPSDPGTVIVEAMDPGMLVEVTGDPDLIAIASEVTENLRAAIASLT